MFLRRLRDSGVEESSLKQNLSDLETKVQEITSMTSQLQTLAAELEGKKNLRETFAGLSQTKKSATKLTKKLGKDL